AIRNTCGSAFVIALKLPGEDGVAGGIDLPMASAINGVLAEHSDHFDLWTWVWGAHARSLYQHLPDATGARHPYLAPIQKLRAEHPSIRSGAIGYLTDPNECEMALNDGTADVVFLGRPLITDAAFPNKAASGNANNIRYCVSCNSCWRNIIEAGALACDNNPRVGDPDEHHEKPVSAKHQRHVVVVGTGVSALEAAHTAAQRGHRVTVVGNIDQVGGKTRLHAQLPGGENLSSVYDYQYLMAQQAGVRFVLNRQAQSEDVLALNPDVVLLATGARASQPAWLTSDWATMGLIPSLREMGQSLIDGIGRSPGRAVLVDHDHTEMTYAIALQMATRFDQITLVTSRERIANDVSLINRQNILQRLFDQDIELICHVEPDSLDGLEEGQLIMKNVYNDRISELSDVVTVVHASSRVPNQHLLTPLRANGLEVIPIGDCRAPRSLMAATHEGYQVANTL
ncbi:NAD-binding protein, partial [Luminiphilus sp.]|nr:NAD-binding protein [Luminiphilus sp.]